MAPWSVVGAWFHEKIETGFQSQEKVLKFIRYLSKMLGGD